MEMIFYASGRKYLLGLVVFSFHITSRRPRPGNPMINCQSDPRAVVKSSLLPSLLIIFLFRFCRLISQDLCPNCYRSNFG